MDAPEHGEPSVLPISGTGGTGYVPPLAELPRRYTGVQRSKKGRQTKRTADTGKATLVQRHTRGRNPGDSMDSIAQVNFRIM